MPDVIWNPCIILKKLLIIHSFIQPSIFPSVRPVIHPAINQSTQLFVYLIIFGSFNDADIYTVVPRDLSSSECM